METVLVLGAYGLIGASCARALAGAGFRVVGLGRSAETAARVLPGVEIRIGDMGRMEAADWAAALEGVDVVVNAAGALQQSGRDDLRAVHVTALERLGAALGARRLIQISAVGASPAACTAFMRTKGEGDAVVRALDAPWVILRPGLVIGPPAYGGTALLRAAAALPVVPGLLPEARIQAVALSDVAEAVVRAARGDLPRGTEADLVEPEGRSLPDTIRAVRRWLGLGAVPTAPVPRWTVFALGRLADLTAWLGWRSPLRTTALRSLADGVTGDPATYDRPLRPLPDILAAIPATVQERWFAHVWPLVPAAVIVLSAFWIVSGVLGVVRFEQATEVLTGRGHDAGFAAVSVLGGAAMDVVLGLAILWRPWARAACLGMAAVACAYLAGGTLLTPDLWADPLGPLVKVVPSILLALMTRALLEDR